MATAAGAVMLLYYVLSRRMSTAAGEEDSGGGERSKSKSRSAKKRLARRPAQAPATWLETISTLSETLRFTYSETLGKWPIGDLAFGINYLIKRQDYLQVASVYAGENCGQLRGPEIIDQLYHYLKLLTFCYLFSKKPFPIFLESSGYSEADVLLQKPKAGILKPSFTILRDENSKCFLLLIRGTHSIKDTLTAATAARWIAKLSTPFLLKALEQNPNYKVKIVGHSLGGGTAALLTYILREQKELSSSTCVTFAPAACMTWELAESGKHFITTIINGSDLVPTFSAASVDDLRSEVTASSWSNDLRDQVERNRILKVIYRSATALGSRLPSIANAKARVVGAGALLRPVSSGTEVMMKRAQDVAQAVVRTRSSISSWTCMGPRRRAVVPSADSKVDDLPEAIPLIPETSESLAIEKISRDLDANKAEYCSSSDQSGIDETDDEDDLRHADKTVATSTLENITEGELWYELEKELQRQESQAGVHTQEEAEAAAEEITEEEKVLSDAVESQTPISSSDVSENLHFYPPGKIMHMVSIPLSEANDSSHNGSVDEQVGIYETPRELYSKLRLSRTMIKDHYMPMYKKVMEQLITQLENEEDANKVLT
ncbi:unnamed protein product [Fraxinus pennsylvanica]|uniref:Mono-/di-acylglycerol lipase n=1 Tax=Fraxinus pennsylvanica TaxID=56036 RepID=A0AAD2E835_9LAMI|nr:unnamed protein product [Fraxinus pennsylvanica]